MIIDFFCQKINRNKQNLILSFYFYINENSTQSKNGTAGIFIRCMFYVDIENTHIAYIYLVRSFINTSFNAYK